MRHHFEKNKLTLLLLIVIFSPYVYTSIRFDHLLIVAIFLYLLLQKYHDLISVRVFLLLVGYYVVVLLSTAIQVIDGVSLSPISPILDSFEWYLRGGVLFLFVSRIKGIGYTEIISLSKIYVFSSVIIGIVAILQLFEVKEVVSPILSLYETGRDGDRVLHTINGRYSSILAQPVSYGIFFLFSVSILLFYGDRLIFNKFLRYLIFLFVFFSAYLSVSKVVLMGIPLLLLFRVLMALFGYHKLKIEDLTIWLLILLVSFYLTIDSGIPIAEHLLNSYGSISSMLDVVLNAIYVRFDQSDGQLATDMHAFRNNILIGVGWSDHGAHMGDSGYMPILVRGGIVGFFLYMAYLIVIFVLAYRSATSSLGRTHPVVLNYVFLILISFIFALGTPIFYIDRSADFLWIISAILISMRNTISKCRA